MSSPNPADELLSAYVDGELTDDQRAAVERRLAADPAAQQTVEALRELSATLQDFSSSAPSGGLGASFTAEVVQRVKADLPSHSQARQSKADQSHEGRAGDSATAGRSLPVGRSPRGWLWAGMALAAALLMAVALPETGREPNQAALKPDAAANPPAPATRAFGAEMEEDGRENQPGMLAEFSTAEADMLDAAAGETTGDPTREGRDQELDSRMARSAFGSASGSASDGASGGRSDSLRADHSMADGSVDSMAGGSVDGGLGANDLAVVEPAVSPPEIERAMIDTVNGAPAGLPMEARGALPARDRFGGLAGDQFGSLAGESSPPANLALESAASASPQLVVHVQLRPQAYQQNLVERVMSTNGIATEPTALAKAAPSPAGPSAGPTAGPTASVPSAQPEEDATDRPASTSGALAGGQGFGGRGFGGQGASEPIRGGVGGGGAGAATTGNSRTITLGDSPNASELNVLVVDAPASQLAATLEDLQNDPRNCISLYCCPVGQQRESAEITVDGLASAPEQPDEKAAGSSEQSEKAGGSAPPALAGDDRDVGRRKQLAPAAAKPNLPDGRDAQQPAPHSWARYNRFDPIPVAQQRGGPNRALQQETTQQGKSKTHSPHDAAARAYRAPREQLSRSQVAAWQLAEEQLAADQTAAGRSSRQRWQDQWRQQNRLGYFADQALPPGDSAWRLEQQSQQPPPPTDSPRRVQALVIIERQPSATSIAPALAAPAAPETAAPETAPPETADAAPDSAPAAPADRNDPEPQPN